MEKTIKYVIEVKDRSPSWLKLAELPDLESAKAKAKDFKEYNPKHDVQIVKETTLKYRKVQKDK